MNEATTSPSTKREILVKLTRKGQVTIPASIRRSLGLPPQGKIALLLNEQAKTVQLQVPRYPTLASLAGAAGSLKEKIPWKETLETARADALSAKAATSKHD